ncbi:uncharacterized protein LOC127838915 isoform X10 [Dreissena polymorpha]|uniref:uncharacterized protein LOC127838915 isoform X2 n=1 Tax=Dreissena polymorpha TaxID=45954 RepID=UPI0022643F0C|nr:uncharacterized protein LOC127838915 isoform X2 [Dreissena polymorpha]XP_052222971.1 uncharacterized protein LOC127838915 isoform X3 [Dreissena polymorpha]XP_052222972.1 uncharacterized protein LOC127838915 isoform X4 [Dreissena polymorpha]XP_052222973.1 uncharacterized protein LOC127838915 isoform X5 [Dreissena polymorpha]XP_052222974.1 uncharacterized protein LOC127838915 isoform X6 [Dreissena polymorpha]XP_052222975.1 uncharacterized protein LOC127838915 isoform X7 [Dreissena polymorpha]
MPKATPTTAKSDKKKATSPPKASNQATEVDQGSDSEQASEKLTKEDGALVTSDNNADNCVGTSEFTVTRPSIGTVMLKWTCSVLFGIVLLVCLVESKLGIMAISNAMRHTTEMRYVRFVMLLIMVLVPSVVNLIRGTWRGVFGHTFPPWPQKSALLWGLCVSFLEALGLCLFVFHIPGIKGMDQPCTVILVMNGVHLCPAVYNLWKAVKKRKNTTIVRNTFGLTFIGAFVVICFCLLQKNVKVQDAWTVPVAIVCLSFAWTPAVQQQLIKSPEIISEYQSKDIEMDVKTAPNNESSQASTQSTPSPSMNEIKERESPDQPKTEPQIQPSTDKTPIDSTHQTKERESQEQPKTEAEPQSSINTTPTNSTHQTKERESQEQPKTEAEPQSSINTTPTNSTHQTKERESQEQPKTEAEPQSSINTTPTNSTHQTKERESQEQPKTEAEPQSSINTTPTNSTHQTKERESQEQPKTEAEPQSSINTTPTNSTHQTKERESQEQPKTEAEPQSSINTTPTNSTHQTKERESQEQPKTEAEPQSSINTTPTNSTHQTKERESQEQPKTEAEPQSSINTTPTNSTHQEKPSEPTMPIKNQPSSESAPLKSANQIRSDYGSGHTREENNKNKADNTKQPCTYDSSRKKPEPWKMIFYISFFKIIFIVAISLLLFSFLLFENRPTLSDFNSGWSGLGKYTWTSTRDDIYLFTVNIVGSAVGYLVAYMACTACMQRLAFTLPVVLATPVSILLLTIPLSCDFLISVKDRGFVCGPERNTLWLTIAAAVSLIVYELATVGWYHFKTENIVMEKETQLFLLPTYNSALLEQWLILVRRNNCYKAKQQSPLKIFICTTMFMEATHEMQQLLKSIKGMIEAQCEGRLNFEYHIFFDGAVEGPNSDKKNKFVEQLISEIKSILELKQQGDSETSYGRAMVWEKEDGKNLLTIHMKNSKKVKNKKRWSQVMYMAYVLWKKQNDKQKNASRCETYILTTDADVMFTPDSVEALLDRMIRDDSLGAVCARTHPLGRGLLGGLLVWYQTFEYAIGHWFQKAAEHVIGTVLCSPGCFSIYRCDAIQAVLPKYATDVKHAYDFLTKDMGEDRWLCTLMVQKGWRIEYCAAAENRTFCPDRFDEFFKQRRRWIASTLANMMIFIGDWRTVSKANPHISIFFFVYQMLLLISTLIGPSSVILVVSGGLKYAWDVRSLDSVITQCAVCFVYTILCLNTSSKKQLWVAKLLTVLYAVIMAVVVVGIAIDVVSDFGTDISPNKDVNATTTLNPAIISPDIRFSTTTVYLGCMVALFLVTGLLHLQECVNLFHGLWYLLFLPSGYLILTLYSICNITDITWGTREDEQQPQISTNPPWHKNSNFYSHVYSFASLKNKRTKRVRIPLVTITLRAQRAAMEEQMITYLIKN